jgi:GntR family transcriptional regulator
MSDKRTLPARVRDQLIELFQSNGMRPGDRLPSEAEVAELCEIGRSTAREALKLLEQEGLIGVERGRGRCLSITRSGQRILHAEDYHRGDAFAFNVLRR